MQKQHHNQQHDPEIQDYMTNLKAVYCNNNSSLIYCGDKSKSMPPDLVNSYLSISFLLKNEGSYCYARGRPDIQDKFINESFSMLHIQKIEGGLDDDRPPELLENGSVDLQDLETKEEVILEIRNPNEDSYNTGYFNREIDYKLQKMLGASPVLRADPHWGQSNRLQDLPLSMPEKQVFNAASMQ